MNMLSSYKQFYKENYLYAPLFCEENIWHLIDSLSSADIAIKSLFCLFITNSKQKFIMLNQQSAALNQAVIWDYHVILLAIIKQQAYIFDFDTRLDFVTPLEEYLIKSFIFSDQLAGQFVPYIRKIPAQSYLKQFYSDRSHMLNQISPSEFPPWPVINSANKNYTSLADYLNLQKKIIDKNRLIKCDSLEHVMYGITL